MKDSVSIIPPYVGESRTSENISDLLFTDSTLRGDFESLEEEEGVEEDGPENKVEVDAGEEFEEEYTNQTIVSSKIPQQPLESFQ
jgi:hypothetical protein